MLFASGFSWFHLIPFIDKDEGIKSAGLDHHMLSETMGKELMVATSSTYVHAWLACGVLILFAVLARMGLEKAKSRTGVEKYTTSESLTPTTFAEIFAEGIKGMVGDLLDPKDVRTFFPLIGGLFLYIITCNLMGIFPGLLPPTDNINTNVGMSITVFLVFNFVGLSRDAAGYIKHLMGPMLFLAPFMFVVEVIGLFVRPISLTLRLTGNMFGDHTVFSIMSDLSQPFLLPVPAVLLLLAILVSTIQAFVFSLLTAIYISLSLPHHEHDEAHAH